MFRGSDGKLITHNQRETCSKHSGRQTNNGKVDSRKNLTDEGLGNFHTVQWNHLQKAILESFDLVRNSQGETAADADGKVK